MCCVHIRADIVVNVILAEVKQNAFLALQWSPEVQYGLPLLSSLRNHVLTAVLGGFRGDT